MSFHDRMSRALGTAADAHEAELKSGSLGDLRGRIVKGVRRRRQMKAVGVVAAAVTVALVTVQVWPNADVVNRPEILPAQTLLGTGTQEPRQYPLGNIEGLAASIDVSDDTVYAGGADYLHTIDIASGETETHEPLSAGVELGEECCREIAVGEDSIWSFGTLGGLVDGESVSPTLFEFDKDLEASSSEGISLSLDGQPYEIDVDERVWILGKGESRSVSFLDPGTDDVQSISVGSAPTSIQAFGSRALAIVQGAASSNVKLIDPDAGGVTNESPDLEVGCADDLSLGVEGEIWVVMCDSTIERFGNRLARVGTYSATTNYEQVTFGGGSLWLLDEDANTVTRALIDDGGLSLYEPVELVEGTQSMAWGAGSLWVGTAEASMVTRITPGEATDKPDPSDSYRDFQGEFCAKQGFVAGYLPDGFTSQYPDKPKADDFPGTRAVFRGDGRENRGRHITVLSEPAYAQASSRDVPVLNTVGSFGEIHEGYSVEFQFLDCDFTLQAFGVEESEFETFVRNLTTKAAPFGAVWPWDSVDAAREGCAGPEGDRLTDRQPAVFAFASEVLGWDAPTVERLEHDYVIRNEGVAVRVHVQDLFDGCWLVDYVGLMPVTADASLSLSVGTTVPDEVTVGSGVVEGTDSITFEIGYGGSTHVEQLSPEGLATFEIDFPHNVNGHFLRLFYDETGKLIGAQGSPLPPGDFAAG